MGDEAAVAREVVDVLGQRHRLGRCLGLGGQGAVFQIAGRPLVVKLVFAQGSEAQEQVQRQIARIRRLPLEGLPVTRPLRALVGRHAGYLMELMTEMQPLSDAMVLPGDLAGQDVVPWYRDGGGLRRRLRLLARLADVLGQLHGRGLSWGDVSFTNVFVSSDPAHHEVWLIDCDNVQEGVNPRPVYTPGYAAPELLRGGGAGMDSLTDAWALAVLTFEGLCVLHPFRGDQVEYGEPELEEAAARGELPWVDDAEQESNCTERGLPRAMVLSAPLRGLAERCFGAGRLDRLRRPGASEWSQALHKAADQTLVCPSCASSYYLNQATCPWCDASRPSFVLVDACLREPAREGAGGWVQDGQGRRVVQARLAVQEGHPVRLLGRHLGLEGADAPWASLSLRGGSLQVEALDGARAGWWLRGFERDRALEGARQEAALKRLDGCSIEPDAPHGVHRVIRFEHVGGAR